MNKLKLGLSAIVIVSAVGLGGCIPSSRDNLNKDWQEIADIYAEVGTKNLVVSSDYCLNVHKFLKEGKYQEAQTILEEYLRNYVNGLSNYKETMDTADIANSESTKEYIKKISDEQMKKIEDYLK